MSYFQILGLMVVRKLLDFVFSQHDLAWLDDILPEKDKKKKDDEKKKKEERKKAKCRDHDSDEEVSRQINPTEYTHKYANMLETNHVL